MANTDPYEWLNNIQISTDYSPEYQPLGVQDGFQADLNQLSQLNQDPTWLTRIAQLGTLIDIPRRALFRAAKPVTNPLLRALGVEHPEDYDDFASSGGELAESFQSAAERFPQTLGQVPLVGGLLEDISQPIGDFFKPDASDQDPGLLNWMKLMAKGAPAAVGAGGALLADIYTDPLTFLHWKTGPAREALEREALKSSYDPLFAAAESKRGTNAPLRMQRMDTLDAKNIPEVSQLYLRRRIQDAVNDLTQAEIKAQKELIAEPQQLAYVRDALSQQAEALRSASRQAFGTENAQSFQTLLQAARSDAQLPLALGRNIEQRSPELGSIFQTKNKAIDPYLQRYVPFDYTGVTAEGLARQQALLEKVAHAQRPGLKAYIPGLGSTGLGPITDITGGAGKVIDKAKKTIKSFFDKATSGRGDDFDIDLNNALISQLPASHPLYSLAQSLKPALLALSPNTPWDKIRIGDVETFLKSKQSTPGGVRSTEDASKWITDLARSQKKSLTTTNANLQPVLEFVKGVGQLDLARNNPGRLLTSFTPDEIGVVQKTINDLIAKEAAAPWYKQPLELVRNKTPNFQGLSKEKPQRVAAWLRRNLRNYTDEQELIQFGVDPAIVGKVKQQINATPIKPAVTSTYEKINQWLAEEQASLSMALTQAKTNGQDPVTAARIFLDAQARNPASKFSLLQEQLAAQLHWNPPAWWEAADTTQQYAGLKKDLARFSQTSQEFNSFIDQWMGNTDTRKFMEFIFAGSQQEKPSLFLAWNKPTKDGTGGSFTLSELSKNSTVDAKAFTTAILSRIPKNAQADALPMVQTLANALVPLAHVEREKFFDAVRNLSANWAEVQDLHRTFQHSKSQFQQLVGITPELLSELDNAYILPALNEIGFAKKASFDFGSAAKAKSDGTVLGDMKHVWQEAWKRVNAFNDNAVRALFRNFNVDPVVVDKLETYFSGQAALKQRDTELARDKVKAVLESTFRQFGANPNQSFNDAIFRQMSPAFGLAFGYKGTTEAGKKRIEQGLKLMAQGLGFDPNDPVSLGRAQSAVENIAGWWRNEMKLVRMADNAAGIPTHFLEDYFPHMIVGDLRSKRIAYNRWKSFQHSRDVAQRPGLGVPFGHAKERGLEDLDELEEFLDNAKVNASSIVEGQVSAPLDLNIDADMLNAYAQRLHNHSLAAHTGQFLREMMLDAPHLINNIKDVRGDVSRWIDDVVADPQLLAKRLQKNPDLLISQDIATLPGLKGIVSGSDPSSVWMREDFAKYLESYIPKSWDWELSGNPFDGLLGYFNSLHHKFNSINVAYNGTGFLKQLAALAAVGGVDLQKYMSNLWRDGANYRNNPLFREAAMHGALPWAGIEHNMPIRDVMNYHVGRTGTDVNRPIQAGFFPTSQTSPVKGIELDPGKLGGFLARGREPEFVRSLTWDLADKNLRLTLYEQALEMGMSKLDAARFARNSMLDYQLNWMNAKAKSVANLIFSFPGWWLGNLMLHVPNMMVNPRMYVIANHIHDVANMYTAGNIAEDNPAGLQSSVMLPGLPGSLTQEPLFWDLQLPWASGQNLIFNKLMETLLAENYTTDSMANYSRMWNAATVLLKYVWDRANTLPVNIFIKKPAEWTAHRYNPNYVPEWLQTDQEFNSAVWNIAEQTGWGVAPLIRAGTEGAGQLYEGAQGETMDTTPFWKLLLMNIAGPVRSVGPDGRLHD